MTGSVDDPLLPERARGAVPLPGGYKGYLVSLRRICERVKAKAPTSGQLTKWMCRTFELTPTTARAYEQFLRKMGLLTESDNGLLRLDVPMDDWLHQQKPETPIALIHGRLRFFGEMLAETTQCRSMEELRVVANTKYGLDWEKPNQVAYRRGWLESGGFVQPREGGLVITPAGRNLLNALDLEPNSTETGGDGGLVEPRDGRIGPTSTTPTKPIQPDLTDEDGFEKEHEQGDVTDIKRPFDPQKIKVESKTVLVAQMVARMKHGEMRAPEFQRKAGIWRARQKSRLVESLLLRIPIPVFYFSADEDDNWALVDGLQRTTAICDFVAGKFALRGLEYLTRYEGKRYGDLARSMQRRIEETSLMANVIQPGTPEEVTFNIFSRINTGGMELTGQEIRHALHQGPVLGFLKDLAESAAFLDATGGSIKDERMADRECVLRFVAFHDRKWEQYRASGDLDRWLGDTMTMINSMDNPERARMKDSFVGAMRLAHDIFGEHAFRKRYAPDDDRKRPPNKALFEAWSVGLAQGLDRQRELVARRDRLLEGSYELMNDQDFEAAVSTATATVKKVHLRFSRVEDLIRECL